MGDNEILHAWLHEVDESGFLNLPLIWLMFEACAVTNGLQLYELIILSAGFIKSGWNGPTSVGSVITI